MTLRRRLGFWLVLGGTSVTAGCAAGPNYQRPTAIVPADYKEIKGWKLAEPRDSLPKGTWWSIYHDPVLSNLESQVEIDNQTLKAARAAYQEAHAVVAEAHAELSPTLTFNPSISKSKGTDTLVSLEGNASWEPDLWGRIRREVQSESAAAQASAADIANAQLSAQASLAADYFQLREADSLQDLLNQTVAQYKRSLVIAQNEYKAGTTAQSDVITAQTQVLTVQAQAINVGVARAQYEHAIAVLTGKPPSDLTVKPNDLGRNIPTVPVSLPSTLLERRPDIAAAERTMAQQNYLIGVATAGYFPTLDLSASGGVAGFPFNAPGFNPVWSLGASAAQTLFNGGLTQAQVAAANAGYQEAIATYRQTVLSAFQQVEDPLSAARILAQEAITQDAAVAASLQAVQIALNEYQAGTQAYTTVVTAQAIALSDEEDALSIREERFAATVSLIEALGGGFDVSQLPTN